MTDDRLLGFAGRVIIGGSDGPLPGYYARPDGPGPFPIVLVFEDIYGLNGYISDVCRRLAVQGYAAVGAEIYARVADMGKIHEADEMIQNVLPRSSDRQIRADSESAINYAIAHRGDPTRIAAVGFGRGGRNVWLFDAYSLRLRAACAWYGPIGGLTSPLQPVTPVEVSPIIRAPLLALYGGKDTTIPVGEVQAAITFAKTAGRPAELVIYPDAPHGFHADDRPDYRPDAARDGWARMLDWFHHYGV